MGKSENLEQVLDILVILPWQVLVLQEVPHRVKLVISLLNGSTDRCSQTFLFLEHFLDRNSPKSRLPTNPGTALLPSVAQVIP